MEFTFALQDDSEAIYDLTCLLEDRIFSKKDFLKTFEDLLENKNVCFILAKENKKTVGYISLYIHGFLHHSAKIAEIGELVVAEEHRCSGVGKELYGLALDEAKKRGAVQLEVDCNVLRERTHKFYERLGMKKYHYKFSLPLTGKSSLDENKIGR